MSETTYPPALDEIIEMFVEAPPRDRLDYLLEFSDGLPDLPERLQSSRDAAEQVHECQSPVFLITEREGERVRFYIDIPREAPTVRGFAGILHQALDGATAAQIVATPQDLYERLGLTQLLSPQRLNGLTALLQTMKRSALRVQNAG